MTATVEDTERALRSALAGVPGLHELDDAAYCEVVAEALGNILDSVRARAEELEDDDA